MTKRISLSEIAHNIVREYLREGDASIDATLGNGHDTLFLAQCVGATGHVYGFDIQIQALEATKLRLHEYEMLSRATLFLASHAEMLGHVPRSVRAIMFNLGYLPGADKNIITRADSTLLALNQACNLLAEEGVMTVMVYPGHAGGEEEARQVEQWVQQLDSEQYQSQIIFSQHHKISAPRLFVVRKFT